MLAQRMKEKPEVGVGEVFLLSYSGAFYKPWALCTTIQRMLNM